MSLGKPPNSVEIRKKKCSDEILALNLFLIELFPFLIEKIINKCNLADEYIHKQGIKTPYRKINQPFVKKEKDETKFDRFKDSDDDDFDEMEIDPGNIVA